MKRQRSSTPYVSTPYKKPRTLTPAQTTAVTALVNRQISRTADKHTCTQSYTNSSVDWSGYIWNISDNLTRGDSPVNQFEGSSIQPLDLTLNWYCTNYGDQVQLMRLVVFQYAANDNPTVGGVLDSTLLSTAVAPLTGYRWENRPLVHVLCDKMIRLVGDTSNRTSQTTQSGRVFISGKKLRKMYMSATAPNSQSNGLHMIILSDSGAAPHPQFQAYTQYTFTD